jgi:hypothetical protein
MILITSKRVKGGGEGRVKSEEKRVEGEVKRVKCGE